MRISDWSSDVCSSDLAGHHHHHHDTAAMDDGRLALAVAVNLLLTVAQIVGGLVSGSLALVADAIHNLSDAAALAIALFARKVARRGADASMTYGYRRAEIVAALINLTTLIRSEEHTSDLQSLMRTPY